jgi:hypothetical protein
MLKTTREVVFLVGSCKNQFIQLMALIKRS